jgi:hypothetical protein
VCSACRDGVWQGRDASHDLYEPLLLALEAEHLAGAARRRGLPPASI